MLNYKNYIYKYIFRERTECCGKPENIGREQMEVAKVAMESKLDKMAAKIERLEADAGILGEG